jgi:hypothetical protein
MAVLPVEETLQDLVKVQSPKPEKNMTSKYSMYTVKKANYNSVNIH